MPDDLGLKGEEAVGHKMFLKVAWVVACGDDCMSWKDGLRYQEIGWIPPQCHCSMLECSTIISDLLRMAAFGLLTIDLQRELLKY